MIQITPQAISEKDVAAPEVGAIWNSQENSCLFSVWAPEAAGMEVAVENKTYALQPESFGYWQNTLTETRPGDRYYFIIDGNAKRPDPASRFQPDGVHGASEIVDPHFVWNDGHWKGMPMEEMIIYELHTGTFSEKGTFEGIAQRLDYLADLGINTLELMPMAQFPGSRNWGYDGVFPFAVQNSYGRPEELKKLVDACHQKGMAILLDVVYNHLGPEGNYLGEYGPYFTDKYKTPWGRAINFDDAYCDGVRNYFTRNALMWLNDYHFDGLRLDAVHAIYDFGAHHIMQALHEQVALLSEKNNRQYVLIAESDLNDVRYISPVEQGGYGLDAQWCDDFHHALHTLITRENNGYYVDFGTTDHLAKALKNSFVYNGNYSPYRKKPYGNNADERPCSQFVVCIQNHDQVGNRLAGDRLTGNISYEKLKLAASVLLLSPYVPMLFMGEEYAEKNPFQYFVSHGDSDLAEAVRKGRSREFSSFKWGGDVPDPQAETTFEQCKLSWNFQADKKQETMLKLYRFLIYLRKQHPALHSFDRSSVEVYPDADKNMLILARHHPDQPLYIIYNFSDDNQFFSVPTAENTLEKIIDTADEAWLGQGSQSPAKLFHQDQYIISKESAIAYGLKKQ